MLSVKDVAEEEYNEGRGCKTCGWYLQVFSLFHYLVLFDLSWSPHGLVILDMNFLPFLLDTCFLFLSCFRKMQVSGATDLASKGQGGSESSNVKIKGEYADPFRSDTKIRCPCGDSLEKGSVIEVRFLSLNVFHFLSTTSEEWLCFRSATLSEHHLSGFMASCWLAVKVLHILETLLVSLSSVYSNSWGFTVHFFFKPVLAEFIVLSGDFLNNL